MSEEQIKVKFLATPVNELPTKHTIIRWFTKDIIGEPVSRVMTLEEFFDANQLPLTEGEKLIVNHKGEFGFKFGSQAWKLLKRFLLNAGFTHHDWVLLLPKIGKEYLFEMLQKEHLKRISFAKVCGLHYTAECPEQVSKIFGDKQPTKELFFRMPVSELLKVTKDDVHRCFFFTDPFGSETEYSWLQVSYLRGYLKRMQGVLESCGLTEEDGPFMTIDFESLTGPHSSDTLSVDKNQT